MVMRVSREEFLGIPTQEERREIARKIRYSSHMCGPDGIFRCVDLPYFVDNIFYDCGIRRAFKPKDAMLRIADLIDPVPAKQCDVEALLEIAAEIEKAGEGTVISSKEIDLGNLTYGQGTMVQREVKLTALTSKMARGWADRIRAACKMEGECQDE